jgi:hypothetical protein
MNKCKLSRGCLFLVIGLVLIGGIDDCHAQVGPLRKAAQELVEFLGRKFGTKGAKELAELGGLEGVEEILEKASKEGGEQLAKKVVQYGEKHGVSSLKLIDQAPAAYVNALDSLPSNLVDDAVRVAARNPAQMTPLVRSYGGKILTAEVKHPGVATKFAERLGNEGLEICAKTNTNEAIAIGRHLDEIAALPAAERQSFVSELVKAPGKLVTFLEKNPKFMITAAAAGTLITAKDKVFGTGVEVGSDGTIVVPPGPGTVIAKSIGTVVIIIGCVVASLIGLWGVTKWRRASVVARLQANQQIASSIPHDVTSPKDAAQ